MNASDPIQTARTLIRLGLTGEALTSLERASVHHPERMDIKKAIEELRYATSAAGRAWLIFDMTIIWTLLLSTGVLLGWLGYQGGLALTRWWTPPEVSWIAPAMFGAVVVGSYAYARIWIFLFLHVWFCYLKYLSRANRHQVEMRLPSYFRVQAVEPQYSQLRRRYFNEQAPPR